MKHYYMDYIKGLEWHLFSIKDINNYKSIYLTGSFSRDEQKLGKSDIDLDFIYPKYTNDIWDRTLDLCRVWKEGKDLFKREGDKNLISFPKITIEEDLINLANADAVRWMRKARYAKLLFGQESYPILKINSENKKKNFSRLAIRELINMYYLLNAQYIFGEWNRGQWQRSLSEFFRCLIGIKTEIIVHRFEDICEWSAYLFGQKDLALEDFNFGKLKGNISEYTHYVNKIKNWSKLLIENISSDNRIVTEFPALSDCNYSIKDLFDKSISNYDVWNVNQWWYQRHFRELPNFTRIYVSLEDDFFYNCAPSVFFKALSEKRCFGDNNIAIFLPKSLFQLYTRFAEPRLGFKFFGEYDDYSMYSNCIHNIAVYFFSMIGDYGEIYSSKDIRKKVKKWISKTESVLSSLAYVTDREILSDNGIWKNWSENRLGNIPLLLNKNISDEELRSKWKLEYPGWYVELQNIKRLYNFSDQDLFLGKENIL